MHGKPHGIGAEDKNLRRRGAQALLRCFALLSTLVGNMTLAAPALASTAQRPVRSMVEVRQQETVIQRWDLSCGAAALATILQYQHGDPISEREITRSLLRREKYLANPLQVQNSGGFSLFDLKRFVDGRGYKGVGYGRLTLPHLIDLAPAIVPINTQGYNHFVVFRGVVGGRVLLADSSYGSRIMTLSRFEDAWIDDPEFGRVGFTVKRRDGTMSPGRLAPGRDDFLLVPDAVLRTALPFSVRR